MLNSLPSPTGGNTKEQTRGDPEEGTREVLEIQALTGEKKVLAGLISRGTHWKRESHSSKGAEKMFQTKNQVNKNKLIKKKTNKQKTNIQNVSWSDLK